MKKTIAFTSLAALMLFGASEIALAAGGVATYNGTGATRGYTSSTGFVKERGDEDNHMGKDADADQDKDKQDETGAGDEDATMQPTDEDKKEETEEQQKQKED